MSQEFRLRNIDKTRKYFLEEIKRGELMSRKHRKVCTNLNYIEHVFKYNYWMYFNFCFYFFDWYSYRNCKFCNTIKIGATAAGIKQFKSIIKKKKKKHGKIVFLAKSKLNNIESKISKALIDSNISHEFVLMNNVLREYDEMKEDINKLET